MRAGRTARGSKTAGAADRDHGTLAVLGGGPAGAISALLALREGLRVTLIAPAPDPRRAGRLEGLSPRLHGWLEREGMLAGFDGITGPLPRRVDWAGISESNREFVVDRGALDAHLCGLAEAKGARRITGHAQIQTQAGSDADTAEQTGGQRRTRKLVRLPDHDLLAPEWIIDARGRTATRADPAALKAQAGLGRMPATIALCGWISGAALPPGILLSARPEGWIWCVALPDGRLWAQFLGDAVDPLPAGNRTAENRLLDAVRGALLESGNRIGRLALEGPLIAREAAPRLPAPITDLHCLPAGDAFAAMDPLSGHGQFWAVSSALAIAAARRSLIADPSSGALCLRYLRERAGETAWRMARIGRDFLALETRFADHPFWAARRDLPDALPAHEQRDDFAVASALVVENGLIAQREVLKTPRSPNGIGWFGPHPAPEVYRLACSGPEAVTARFGPQSGALIAALAKEAEAPV